MMTYQLTTAPVDKLSTILLLKNGLSRAVMSVL